MSYCFFFFWLQKDQFEKYIPYGSGRENAELLLSGDEVKKFLKVGSLFAFDQEFVYSFLRSF